MRKMVSLMRYEDRVREIIDYFKGNRQRFTEQDYLENTTLWEKVCERNYNERNIRLYTFYDTYAGRGEENQVAVYVDYLPKYLVRNGELTNSYEEMMDQVLDILFEGSTGTTDGSFSKKYLRVKGELDTYIVSKRRKEQKKLRDELFEGLTTSICGICGEEYPVDLLVVAHIKKRSEASKNERLDKNIVIPMCKFGCDDLFENGYITVVDGYILSAKNKLTTPALTRVINKLISRKCHSWNENNSKFFEWHHCHHRSKQSKKEEIQ